MKYPFTPELLDALPEELASLYRELEQTLLQEICVRLQLKENLNEVTVQDIRALRSHGISLEEIEKAIRETTGISAQKLRSLMDDVVARNQEYYTELIDFAKVTQPQTLVDEITIDAIRRQTEDAFSNITGSMGFLVNAGRTKLGPADAYQWALDSAELQIQSGAISYAQAIKNAVKQLADSGIRTVSYESGHVDQVDVAVRRAVMTGVSQLCAQYTEQSAEYLETNYYEISAHIGARDVPGPSPWSSHKEWQGRVYSTKSGDKYPSIYSVCGLGYVDGLEGANCRHIRSPFIEGVSERTYTDDQLKHIDDGHDCTYEGKHYSAYEATQKQRQIERTIRKLRREEAAYKAVGLEDDALDVGARRKRLSRKYTEFSKAAGLPEQRERAQVVGIQLVKHSNNLALASAKFVNKSDLLYKYSQNIQPIEGFEDIVVHGDAYGFVFKNADGVESNVSVYEFAEILKNSNLYKGGNIRLISCETGKQGAVAAQGLSDALGVTILAPTDYVYIDPDGGMIVSSDGFTNDGEWVIINPKNKRKEG